MSCFFNGILCSIWTLIHFAQADLDQNLFESSITYPVAVFIGVISLVTLAVICWTLTFLCIDCFNAEVDSTSHPACQSSGSGMAFSRQAVQQNEELNLNHKYFISSQQHSSPQYPPIQDQPFQYLKETNHCYSINPSKNPSAPNFDQGLQGYQNSKPYYSSMQGYNHSTAPP